jgi:cytochrome bd ubiquinol oxidase subunit II
VTSAQIILAVLWIAVTLYAVLAGADFGGGVLDLLSHGSRSDRQREAISKAMGPVWEANHVWLIFFITGLFSAFPQAFATLSVALYLPAVLALRGIALRGAAFAFRSHIESADIARSRLGLVFGIASAVTPALFGAAAGGLARQTIHEHAGRVHTNGLLAIWLGPFQIACAALALAVCAMLAASFLCVEMQRAGEAELTEDFRRRALQAAVIAGALSLLALILASSEAPRLYDRLTGHAIVPVLLGILAGTGATITLLARRYRAARALTATAVTAVVWGWGLAQYPQLAGPDVTLRSAAASPAELNALLIGGGAGIVVLLPALWLLYSTFRKQPVEITQ